MALPRDTTAVAYLYEYARHLPPFKRIKLPPADEVKFKFIKDPNRYATWQWDGTRHVISISSIAVGHSLTLLTYLGHEMCHAAVHEQGLNTGGNENTHNSAFRRLAARFCKVHGLDPLAFF